MNSSIPRMIEEVKWLENKTNGYLKAIRELEKQSLEKAREMVAGDPKVVYSLKLIQTKIRRIRMLYFEKTVLLEKLIQKVGKLREDAAFFTAEDIRGFETALNEAEAESMAVDNLNPLFSNIDFLQVIKSALEENEIYEKCAILQKQINRLRVE